MKTYKVTYHYGAGYFPYVEYVKGKDEDDARMQAQILLDNEDARNLIIDKVVDADQVYYDHGFKNRDEYLNHLADEYNVDPMEVQALAEVLGRSEDFDGLVSALDSRLYR